MPSTHRGVFTCLSLLVAAAPSLAHSRLYVQPAQALEGDVVSVVAAGLSPGTLVTLHVQSLAGDEKRAFYGEADFKADKNGRVDLATATAIRGYYHGIDARGLFWSQRLVGDADRARIAALHLDDPMTVPAGQQILTLERRGVVLDREVLTLRTGDSDILREEVHCGDWLGVYYHRPRAVQLPAVVILGGAEGGRTFADLLGPALASRGFAAFGLVYFSPASDAIPGVPTALNRIPVEQLEKARAWLAARPEVAISRLGIVGASKGGEFALELASIYEWVNAAVAYVPSDIVWQGFGYGVSEATMGSSWTRHGEDIPFLRQTGQRDEIIRGRQPGAAPIELARISRANISAASSEELAAASIPIERSHAALLLVGGGDDRTGDSGASVERAGNRLKRESYRFPYQALIYPHAGHGIVGTGWRPTTTHNTGIFNDGGTPQADAEAQADSWIKALEFLRSELRP
jgi:dienelactone hydrolase